MSHLLRALVVFRKIAFVIVFVSFVFPGGIGTIFCLAQASDSSAPDVGTQPPAQGGGPLAAPVTTASGQPSSVTVTPDAAPALPDPLGEASALYRKGDWDGAMEKYQALVREQPTSPDGAVGVARVYLKQKKVDEAARSITQAIAASNSPKLHVV